MEKPITAEELVKFTETEMLYHSNFIRLEVNEVLKHCTIKHKHYEDTRNFLKSLYTEITKIPESECFSIDSAPWLKSFVAFPLSISSVKVDKQLGWFAPLDVKVIGSYQLNTCLKDSMNIDLLLVMPQVYLKRSDFRDHCYFQKRAFYLSFVAYYLSQSQPFLCILKLNKKLIRFSYFMDDPFKPVINITLPDSNLTVRIHAGPPSDYFKEVNLSPGNSSLKTTTFPTPHYNNAVLVDVKMELHLHFLHKFITDNQAFKEAIILLKMWLKHRQFDQGFGSFNGFVMSMFIANLMYRNKINQNMSSYQIIRNVFQYLASSNWMEQGLSFEPVSDMEIFHEHFEVVFLGPSGNLNLCANMSSFLYKEVVHEAKVSFALLNRNQSEFYTIFLKISSFLTKFDCILHISEPQVLSHNFSKSQENEKLHNYGGNCINAILPKLTSVLKRGLDQRVDLIGIKPHCYKSWSINESPPTWNQIEGTLCFGLLFNVENFDESLIKGPSADLPEAVGFRKFWGGLSDLRRFKDGSICEAVLWEENNIKQQTIPIQICRHLLELHCHIPSSAIVCIASSFDQLLKQSGDLTGEELSAEARIVFDDLHQQLMSLNTLPLSITNVYGLSPVLRGTEVYPPNKLRNRLEGSAMKCENSLIEIPFPHKSNPQYTSAIEMVCFFESSRSWPKNPGAIQRMKSAFCSAISNELRSLGLATYATASCTYIAKKHCLFKLTVGYRGEKNVLQSFMTETGMLKSEPNAQSLAIEKETLHRPRLATELESLSIAHPAFSSTCRLAKKWLASHLLLDHFSHEAVDLLCAKLFQHGLSSQPPRSSQTGFLRFLHLLTSYDFLTVPLIVELKHTMSEKERLSISKYVSQHREVLPAICIMTPQNRNRSIWTEQGPELVVVQRMKKLAQISLEWFKRILLSGEKDPPLEKIFSPSLASYDLVIYLKSEFPPKHFVSSSGVESNNLLPAVEFNPVKLYINSLQESFGEFALFFHDCYKKNVIAVLWRPVAFQKFPFKVMSLSCKKLEDGELTPHLDAIVEDIRILGSGLIDSIERRR